MSDMVFFLMYLSTRSSNSAGESCGSGNVVDVVL